MATRKFRMVSAQESGIGGFLLLFVASQILAIGLIAWEIPNTFAAAFGPAATIVGRMDSMYVPLVVGELFFQLARCVAFIMGLVLMFRRDRRTPTFYLIVLAGIAVLAVLDMVLAGRSGHAIVMYLVAQGKPTAAVEDALSTGQIHNVRGIGYCVIWFLYWRSSERVRLTFEPASGMTEIPKPS